MGRLIVRERCHFVVNQCHCARWLCENWFLFIIIFILFNTGEEDASGYSYGMVEIKNKKARKCISAAYNKGENESEYLHIFIFIYLLIITYMSAQFTLTATLTFNTISISNICPSNSINIENNVNSDDSYDIIDTKKQLITRRGITAYYKYNNKSKGLRGCAYVVVLIWFMWLYGLYVITSK